MHGEVPPDSVITTRSSDCGFSPWWRAPAVPLQLRSFEEAQFDLFFSLAAWWEPNMYCMHSPTWWQSHWKRTGIVDVELADSMRDGWQAWVEWQAMVAPKNLVEIRAVESDTGNYLGYIRVVSRRRHDAKLDEIVASIPSNYIAQPLLRSDETRTSR
jgi:hypothetical protein